ncbi:MAG TPA: hypothetical protein VLW17_11800 [Thermoanaerobaculaceae bacterium]|nr:hypothetical protein [Thermoanaerobaculaceae bacterium]
MNSRTIPLAACALLLAAGPLFAQGNVDPATPADAAAATAATHVTGSVVGVGDHYLQVAVDRVLDATPDAAAALSGKTITLTLDEATVKPGALNPADHVELWFKDVLSAHLATRVVLAPAAAAPTAAGTASADVTAPANPNAAQGAPAAAPNLPAGGSSPGPVAAGESAAPQPASASPEEGAAAAEPARPLAPARLAVKPEAGGDWVLLGAAGLVALMALVALRLTVRAKPASTGLHLGHDGDWR